MSEEVDTSVSELSDLNLTYLLLAQRMLRKDRTSAMLRLGISNELADLLTSLTTTQIVKLAGSQFALCAIRLPDVPIAAALRDPQNLGLEKAHLAIMFASRRTDERLAA